MYTYNTTDNNNSGNPRTPRQTQRETEERNSIATQWTSWANHQVQQHPDQSTVDSLLEKLHRPASSNTSPDPDRTCSQHRQEMISRPSSTRSEISQQQQQQQQKQQQQQQQQKSKGQVIVPSKDQLDIILPETPLCFCHKPAHRAFTLEFGPILECGSFSPDAPSSDDPPEINRLQKRYVCGFHVHELSWSTFCDQIRKGKTIYAEHPELQTCSLYNFTYCAMFRVTNSYNVNPPISLPLCFCRRPVAMRVHPRDGLQLACKNSTIDGARKCSWVLRASDVAFPRPKFSLHTYVSHDYYIQKRQKVLDEIRKESAEDNKDQHKHDLLATLSGSSTGPNNSATNTGTPTTPVTHHLLNPLSSANAQSNEVIDFGELALQEQENQQRLQQKALFVPTCVMAKKTPKQPSSVTPALLSTSTSSSSSSSLSSSVTEAFMSPTMSPSSGHQSFKKEITELRQELAKERRANSVALNEMRLEISKLKLERDKAKAGWDKVKQQMSCAELSIYRIQNLKDEQNVLLRNCQKKIQEMELSVVDIVNEKVVLQEEVMALLEEKERMHGKEDDKHSCILCYTQPIEYCLIPCFHYAFCQECSSKLTECPICRKSIKRVQKMYTP